MLKRFNLWLYQLRAEIVRKGPMIDSNSIHFPLYPLSQNAQRMMRFSGNQESASMSPMEVSDFLYQLSHENFSELTEKSLDVERKNKEIDKKYLPLRLISFAMDPEYRQRNLSKKSLEEKERFIKLSSDYLAKLLRISNIQNLPVGVASNTLYAAAKLNLNISQEISNVLIPLINAKVQHLHLKGIVESVWALTSLGYKDKNTLNSLLNELKSRKVTGYREVINAPWNHLEYVYDPDPIKTDLGELLSKTSDLVSEPDMKATLQGLVALHK